MSKNTRKRFSNKKILLILMAIFLVICILMVAIGIIQNGYENKISAIINLVVLIFFFTIIIIATIREK